MCIPKMLLHECEITTYNVPQTYILDLAEELGGAKAILQLESLSFRV